MNARFTSKADFEAKQTDVRFVPKADIRPITVAQNVRRRVAMYTTRRRLKLVGIGPTST